MVVMRYRLRQLKNRDNSVSKVAPKKIGNIE